MDQKFLLQIPPKIFDFNVPILGICYGFQILVKYFDGSVESSGKAEYGRASINFYNDSKELKKEYNGKKILLFGGIVHYTIQVLIIKKKI